MSFEGNQIDTVLKLLFEAFKKNDSICMSVSLDKPIPRYHQKRIPYLLHHWTYPLGDRDIRPFRMKNITMQEDEFSAHFLVFANNQDIHVIKLLCQDLIDIFNHERIRINEIIVVKK